MALISQRCNWYQGVLFSWIPLERNISCLVFMAVLPSINIWKSSPAALFCYGGANHVNSEPYSSVNGLFGVMNQVSVSIVQIEGSESGVFLENASYWNALCPQLSSTNGNYSLQCLPVSSWGLWSHFIISSTPTPAALFWMAAFFLRYDSSIVWATWLLEWHRQLPCWWVDLGLV